MAKNKSQTNSQAQLLKGSAWMTIGSILSRILGAIYIIPWYAWMGKYGNLANSLTAKSYNIYSLFIIISTAGIPGAIAKQIVQQHGGTITAASEQETILFTVTLPLENVRNS